MSLPEKAIKEFQEIYNKKNEKKMSFDEASEAAHNLEGLVRLLYDSALRDVRRNERLKKEPKGFHLDDGEGYTCPICKYTMSYQETWYDKRGMKCIHCQKALDKHVIPVSVLKNDKSWYSMHDFSYYFGIKSQSIRKLVRLGELKSRIIYGPNDSIRAEIFLIKDNLDVLGGKPKSYAVQNKDGSISIEYEKITLPKVLEELRTK